ncbi:Predicted nuclease of the RNAse H fold, HicB family [Ruminococcaceae bacterium YRB3002]|nr:Predicted nuclease of the RNAse H fold, HicB family [Ruminococcaceae bacterium YRB3002]
MRITNSKYTFPAVFRKERKGGYYIYFPDLEDCYTSSEDITQGILMAEDVLAQVLFNEYEEKDLEIPEATPIPDIRLRKTEFATYIVCDTQPYRIRFSQRAVKKTLTIPEWLNEAAMEEKINFSQVLQEALMNKLNLG